MTKPELYSPTQCTNCGKYKVTINGTTYVTNGRIVSEDIPGLYVSYDENNNIYFSLTRHPYTVEKWKVIEQTKVK